MGRRNRWGLAACLLVMLLTLGACQRQVVFHHYHHITDDRWDKSDTVQFFIPRVAEAGLYHEEVELRIDKSYPFQGLTLIVGQTIVPGMTKTHDVLNCSLISQRGVIKGNGVTYFQYRFPIRDIHLDSGDSIHLCIRHNMKRELMPGIADVGIRLTRAKPSLMDEVPASVDPEKDK